MPTWKSEPVWKGHDVFVIGGGPSLTGFDWFRLRGHLTVGCNSAYLLGVIACKICVFGDGSRSNERSFWNKNKDGLAAYAAQGGVVFTNHPALFDDETPWLWTMRRQARGLSTTERLGWNHNTGSTAINLALLLGARRLYLLGFDMRSNGTKNNWHSNGERRIDPAVYHEFIDNYKCVARDWHEKFNDRIIVNLTPDSALPDSVFPRGDVDDVLVKA